MNIVHVIKSEILNRSGLTYISQENIGDLLENPAVLLLAAATLLLLAYYDYLEITTLVIYCETRRKGEEVPLWKLCKRAFFTSLRVFHYKNLPIFLTLVPVIALSVLPLAGGYLNRFQIPEFIMDYIRENPALFLAFLAVLVLLNVVFFFFVFSFPAVILDRQYFWGSLRNSRKLLKSRKIKTVLYFFVYTLSWMLSVVAGFCGMVFLLWIYSKFGHATDGGRSVFQFYYQKWSAVGSTLLHMIGSVALWPLVIYLYHHYRGEEAAVSKKIGRSLAPKRRKQKLLFRLLSVTVTVALLAVYSETTMGESLYGVTSQEQIAVVAHRAGAVFAPENTVAALKEAIDAGAEIAEIDVQQTKDGVLVILHDASLRRTAGLNQKIWEVDFDTVRSLDAGSWFSDYFAGEPIPTLQEMLEAAKDNIQLMIELKSTGHEENLVENTMQQIEDAGMQTQCMVASMDLNLLKRAKEINPSIETVYISTLIVSNDYDISFVDSYSIETSFLTTDMVAQIHRKGKKVYAWTANKEESIRKIMRLNTDGLVTDNPRLARYCLNSVGENTLLEFLTDRLYGNQ